MATLALKVSFDKIYIQHSIRFVLCIRQTWVNFVSLIRQNVIFSGLVSYAFVLTSRPFFKL